MKHLKSILFISVSASSRLGAAQANDCTQKAEAAGLSRAQKEEKSATLKTRETFQISKDRILKLYKVKKSEIAFGIIVERADAANFRYDVILNKDTCRVRTVKASIDDVEGPTDSPPGA